ncbi:MAG: DUF87 domain-containing protein [Candidatus Lokiarchaeota archaeon]|nr:DUF87 domain-containing protein [Candidatus Lokiarchaeota archaeon]
MIIAIVGKGGTGKSMFTALFTRAMIKAKKKKILVIDADPAYPHLAKLLGVKVQKDLEHIRKEIVKQASKKDEEAKHDLVGSLDYMLFESLYENNNFSMLVMGQPELSGCFCPSNSLLRESIEILAKNYDNVIIDCEAGLEQINRKVIQKVNTIIVVSDAAMRSLETAISIKKTAKLFTKYENMFLIFNKVSMNLDKLEKVARDYQLSILGSIPFDENIQEIDLSGKTIFDLDENSISFIATLKILENLKI